MGIFKSSLESDLIKLYVTMLTPLGMSRTEAKEIAKEMIASAKSASEKEGTNILPDNFGDVLLKEEKNDIKVQEMLAPVRMEGVIDKDIRDWWNRNDLERRVSLEYDKHIRFVMFSYYIENPPYVGMSRDEINEYATTQVKKYNAIHKYSTFQSNDDDEDFSADRKLPGELKDRVNSYIQKRMQNPDAYKDDIENSSSFNALIRKEIQNGNL